MPGTNEILQFAGDPAASPIQSQATYLADPQRLIGNQIGIAKAEMVNKALRQSSLVAAAVAQFIADNQADNIVDTLTAAQLATKLQAALAAIFVVADASLTVKGIVELATGAEALAGTDAVRAITPSTLRSGLSASGNAPIFAPRAWVTFNGAGTIQASGNVSSVTKNSTGDYTINFTTAMPNANYAIAGMTNRDSTPYNCFLQTSDIGAPATGSCRIVNYTSAGGIYDVARASLTFTC